MARYRSRRRGLSLPMLLGSTAVVLLLSVVAFVGYVYFFVPLDEGEEAGSTPLAATQAASTGSAVEASVVANERGSLPQATPTRSSSPVPATRRSTPGSGIAAQSDQDNSFRSSLFPYSANHPENWAPRTGGLKVGDMTVDAFLGPAQAGFTPSITIFAQPVPEGVSSEAFLLSNLQSLGKGGIQAKSQPESVPSGAKASMISYTAAANGLRYNVDQVVFVQNGNGWVVTLSSPLSDSGTCVAALRQFLSSFKADAPRT